MKHKKQLIARIVAGFALFAIILWIVGTGILMIFENIFSSPPELTQEQLQEYINSLSGATASGTSISVWETQNMTGSGT